MEPIWGKRYNIGNVIERGAVLSRVKVKMKVPRDRESAGIIFISCFGEPSLVKKRVEKWIEKHFPEIKVLQIDYHSTILSIDYNSLPKNIEEI